MLLHALLTPSPTQEGLLRLIRDRTGLELPADRLEVYVEVEPLRDAWFALGDHHKYTAQVHEARWATLKNLLREACHFHGSDTDLLNLVSEHGFFWSTPKHSKLHSPGRWPLAKLPALPELGGAAPLKALKSAFNSKPDLLLLGNRADCSSRRRLHRASHSTPRRATTRKRCRN